MGRAKEWIPAEVKRLREYVEAGLNPVQVAQKLRRSRKAILIKAQKCGIKFRRFEKSLGFSSNELMDIISKGVAAGKRLTEIAAQLNVKPGSLCGFLNRNSTSVGAIRKELRIEADLGIDRFQPAAAPEKKLPCGLKRGVMSKCYHARQCHSAHHCPIAKNGIAVFDLTQRGESCKTNWRIKERGGEIRFENHKEKANG